MKKCGWKVAAVGLLLGTATTTYAAAQGGNAQVQSQNIPNALTTLSIASLGPSTDVPEPGCLALIAPAAFLVLRRRSPP